MIKELTLQEINKQLQKKDLPIDAKKALEHKLKTIANDKTVKK